MTSTIRKALIAGGLTVTALAGGGLGGAMLDGVASAQADDSTTTAPAHSDDVRDAREPRQELTGPNASKALAAAKAAVTDATPLGVHSGRDGGYVVGMRKSDGTHVRVVLDADFKVTDVREGRPHRHGHRGPRGQRPGATPPTTAASNS